MAGVSREKVMKAFYKQLKEYCEANGIEKVTRKFKMWTDVPTNERPQLHILEQDENIEQSFNVTPSKTTLKLSLFLYTTTTDDAPGIVEINNLLDVIDAALAPVPVINVQNLGGIVANCYIKGKIIKEAGELDGDGMAIIPIEILIP